ncbi:DUF4249 family protein [Flagellimonas algicola]|uniref:DUF4249 family protein n=1 Tax=Flagellimonas algicola TaxID=2583815 RepID=A0ABY2WQA0_9FLAO|nr:DUF4249 family protein [Allomuricauda algicola]TMU56846.1 DUF4249 family protein [Allomuricauda algicola]
MKKIIPYLFLIVLLFSCEDVIEVDVPQEDPRLIVEALIRLDPSETSYMPIVKVSLTSSFFGTIPLTGLRDISIVNLSLPTAGGGNGIILQETAPGSGIYQDPDPVGLRFFEEGELLLQLEHEGRLYFARTYYVPSAPMDDLRQGDDILFDDDDIELEVTITDDGSMDNFYVMDYGEGEFLALEDKFFNGEQFSFSFFPERTLNPGDEVTVTIMGADREFFNYMDLLVEQTTDNQGVFETPVATPRGNIFDVTDLDNIDLFDNVGQPDVFPLGYFAVVQEYKRTIIIE